MLTVVLVKLCCIGTRTIPREEHSPYGRCGLMLASSRFCPPVLLHKRIRTRRIVCDMSCFSSTADKAHINDLLSACTHSWIGSISITSPSFLISLVVICRRLFCVRPLHCLSDFPFFHCEITLLHTFELSMEYGIQVSSLSVAAQRRNPDPSTAYC